MKKLFIPFVGTLLLIGILIGLPLAIGVMAKKMACYRIQSELCNFLVDCEVQQSMDSCKAALATDTVDFIGDCTEPTTTLTEIKTCSNDLNKSDCSHIPDSCWQLH